MSPRSAISTVDQFSEYLDLSDYTSQILHPLLRTLDSSPDLRPPAMDLMYSLATQLGQRWQVFIPGVARWGPTGVLIV